MPSFPELLIVDETPAGRALLRQELAGTDIAIAAETGPGPEAFNLARELRPAVILVSLEEPLVRSLKTMEALASNLPECPIIAVSSAGTPAMMRKAMLAGARDFVSRPFQKGQLREAVETLVRLQENRRLSQQVRAGDPVEQGCIITVFGPKGGIGKTTLAINLGVSMAKAKHNVALVDLDNEVGAASVMLNLMPKQSVQDLADHLNHMDPELLRTFMTPHPSGLQVLAAPLDPSPGEDITPDEIARALSLIAASYEYVLVDAPNVMDERIYRVLRESTYILLMTSLEIAAIRMVKRKLESMRTWEFARDKIKVVVNSANSANSIKKADIEEVLDFPVFWHLPHDPNVGVASQVGQSLLDLYPGSKASQSIASLHYALTGLRPEQKRGISFPRLFRR